MMKPKATTLIAALAMFGMGLAIVPTSEALSAVGDVVFHVRIEPKRGGQVLCALYRDESNWLTHKTFRGERSEASNSYATCRFSAVPKGSYAIAALHDEDRDGEMDKFLGLPLEGYAASRNAHLRGIGAPDWEDAIFSHRTEKTVQRARMKY
jgi:uncharacterized protein (DUF2141 family)